MKLLLEYIKYELLPEYSEKSQFTDLFLEHKLMGWLGLFTIFILICIVIYFQLKIWESEDRLENKKLNKLKRRETKEKK